MEAYSVAVRVSLINGAASGLMALARQFNTTHVSAMALKKELRGIGLLMVGGGMMAAGGAFGLHMIGKTLPYAKEYANQLSLMNTLGMRQADIAKVVGQAWKASMDVPSTTAAGNLKTFRELRSVFGVGHESEAASMLPIVGRIQGALTALTGREQENVGFDLVKAIELRTGVMTQAALQRNAELLSRTMIGMGGTVTVSDFHGALKMGKMATNKWSDDFTYSYLPTLMQELKTASGGGAQTAGTALMSLYQQMHGRMTKAAMPLWVASGLVNASDVVRNGTGSWQMKPGAVKGTGLEETNPFLWVQQYLRPAVDKMAAARHISTESVINSMFSNRNAAFAAYNMYTKAQQYDRDKQTIGQADSYSAYQKLLKTNPELAQLALQKQWQNLLGQLGFTIMPALIKGMTSLIGILQKVTAFTRAHPRVTGAAVGGFAALSGLLLIGGIATMLVGSLMALGLAFQVLGGEAAFIGPLATSLRTLGTTVAVAAGTISWPAVAIGIAVTAIGVAAFQIWRHWDSTKGVFQNIKAELGMFWSWLGGVASWIGGVVGKLWDLIPAPLRNLLAHGDGKKRNFAGEFNKAMNYPNISNPSEGFRSNGAPKLTVNVHNKIDRHGLTTAVMGGIARMADSTQLTAGYHDQTMSPIVPGLAGNFK
jgi:hypothetical protein